MTTREVNVTPGKKGFQKTVNKQATSDANLAEKSADVRYETLLEVAALVRAEGDSSEFADDNRWMEDLSGRIEMLDRADTGPTVADLKAERAQLRNMTKRISDREYDVDKTIILVELREALDTTDGEVTFDIYNDSYDERMIYRVKHNGESSNTAHEVVSGFAWNSRLRAWKEFHSTTILSGDTNISIDLTSGTWSEHE